MKAAIPIFVVVVFFTLAGTAVTTLALLNGCGNCGKWANCGCAAAFQYSVVTGLVVTSSLLFVFFFFFVGTTRKRITNFVLATTLSYFIDSCHTWSLLAIHHLSRFLRSDSDKIRIRLRSHLPIYFSGRKCQLCYWPICRAFLLTCKWYCLRNRFRHLRLSPMYRQPFGGNDGQWL